MATLEKQHKGRKKMRQCAARLFKEFSKLSLPPRDAITHFTSGVFAGYLGHRVGENVRDTVHKEFGKQCDEHRQRQNSVK